MCKGPEKAGSMLYKFWKKVSASQALRHKGKPLPNLVLQANTNLFLKTGKLFLIPTNPYSLISRSQPLFLWPLWPLQYQVSMTSKALYGRSVLSCLLLPTGPWGRIWGRYWCLRGALCSWFLHLVQSRLLKYLSQEWLAGWLDGWMNGWIKLIINVSIPLKIKTKHFNVILLMWPCQFLQPQLSALFNSWFLLRAPVLLSSPSVPEPAQPSLPEDCASSFLCQGHRSFFI